MPGRPGHRLAYRVPPRRAAPRRAPSARYLYVEVLDPQAPAAAAAAAAAATGRCASPDHDRPVRSVPSPATLHPPRPLVIITRPLDRPVTCSGMLLRGSAAHCRPAVRCVREAAVSPGAAVLWAELSAVHHLGVLGGASRHRAESLAPRWRKVGGVGRWCNVCEMLVWMLSRPAAATKDTSGMWGSTAGAEPGHRHAPLRRACPPAPSSSWLHGGLRPRLAESAQRSARAAPTHPHTPAHADTLTLTRLR